MLRYRLSHLTIEKLVILTVTDLKVLHELLEPDSNVGMKASGRTL